MDLALDDIIAKTGTGRRGRGGGRGMGGGRGGGRRGGGGGGGFRSQQQNFTRVGSIPEGRWGHDRFEGVGGGGRGGGGAQAAGTAKLLISNLDWSVSDADITELFCEFGGLRRAGIHYDASGRSLGSGDVVFERRGDAIRAMKQYNNVPLDGRPMKIELVGPGATATTGAVAKARQAAQQMRPSRGAGGGGGMGGGRGGGRGRGRGGRRNDPVPTQEDLDAELDAYVNKSA